MKMYSLRWCKSDSLEFLYWETDNESTAGASLSGLLERVFTRGLKHPSYSSHRLHFITS